MLLNKGINDKDGKINIMFGSKLVQTWQNNVANSQRNLLTHFILNKVISWPINAIDLKASKNSTRTVSGIGEGDVIDRKSYANTVLRYENFKLKFLYQRFMLQSTKSHLFPLLDNSRKLDNHNPTHFGQSFYSNWILKAVKGAQI